jgi:prepilin-type processing-associated H-X9-DG protein
VNGPTSFVGKYKPDIHEPFTVGTGLGNTRAFHGLIDEVAVYTNVITDINQHYTDGMSGADGAYFSDVTNDNAVIYLRMDSTNYTAPAPSTWPVLVNYGQTNGVASSNGVYTPGTMPGLVAGAAYPNFPFGLSGSNVPQFSGVSSYAVAGYSAGYNPTGTSPFTVSAIFRGNPTDTNRVQSIVGHGTNSWELGLTVGGQIVFNSGTNSAAVVATGTGAGDLTSITSAYDDGKWHQVVAVHNNTTNVLYVDGAPINTNVVTANNVGNTLPVLIGSDPCYTNTPIGLGRQFSGQVCEVAFFNSALTSAQILSLYNGGVAPSFTLQPASTNVSYGGVLMIQAAASGSAPLTYQWYDVNASSAIAGQTNATLVINNITANDSYYVVASNFFGVATSMTASANVISGAPQVITDVKNPFYGVEGGVTSNSVAAYGTAPLTYQWQFFNGSDWVNLTDGGRISGSATATLDIANTLPSDAGEYQVVVSNAVGSTTSSEAQLIVAVLPLNFNNNGLFWTSNGSARIANSTLSLTDPNNGGGNGSFFFQVPQYIGAFAASFTYTAGGNRAADGVSFCLQNDPRGPAALGAGGSGLGMGGTNGTAITPSVELMLDIFGGSGFAAGTNGANYPTAGANSTNFAQTGDVFLYSGDPINVSILYQNGQMALTFADPGAGTSFSTNLNLGDITSVLGGNTAYVGLTGAYGGSTSMQTITSFSFVSLATEAISKSGGNVVVAWPGPIVGYALQANSNLTTANWLNVTNADNVTNGQHQIVLPLTNTNLFYRLMLLQ